MVLTIAWIMGSYKQKGSSVVNRLSTYRPPRAVSLEEVISALPNPDVGPPLPNEYLCGATKSNCSIPSNLVGWVHYLRHPQLGPQLVCLAKRSITLFFGPFACIELKIQAMNQDVGCDVDSIQVRIGTQFLIRQAVEHSGRIQKVKFCTDNLGSIDNQYNLVTIGLTTKDEFKDSMVHKGFHLLAVKALSPQRKISQ